MKRIFLSACLFLSSLSSLLAFELDSFFVSSINTQSGLISDDVTCMIQDNQGFMWYGTNNGLCRYDGHEFVTYKSNYQTSRFFTGNSIVCLAIDKNNCLWIGTTSGLNIFNLETGDIKQFSFDKLRCKLINTIAIDKNNNAYIGTDNGIFRYNSKEESFDEVYTDAIGNTVVGNYIQTLFVDSQNILWIGMWHTGFCTLDLNTYRFVYYTKLADVKDLSISCFMEDRNGNIWFSTWSGIGICRLENPHDINAVKATIYRHADAGGYLSSSIIYGLVEDEKTGNIWIATAYGLNVLIEPDNPASIINYHKYDNDIFINEISVLFKDRSGIIWFSVQGNGCYSINQNRNVFNQNHFSKLRTKNELIKITSVYKTKNDVLWMGIRTHNLALFDRKTNSLIKYSDHPQLKNIKYRANTVLDIIKGDDNKLWISTRYDAAYMVELSDLEDVVSVEKIKENQELKTPNTTVLTKVPSGDIWVGTIKGINIIRKNKAGEYEYTSNTLIDKTIASNHIKSFWCDNKDNLWIGTEHGGLFNVQFSEQSLPVNVINYSIENGKINSNEILCIFKDTKQRFWIGTQGGGLCLYNQEKDAFEIINNMNLMPDDVIYSIQEDKTGALWLSTGKGLVCYRPEFQTERQMRSYTRDDGLEIFSFYSNSSFKDDKGELFFGGNDGIVSFFPEQFSENVFSPTPVITDVLLSNISILGLPAKERNKITKNLPPFAHTIRLSHKSNNIRIEFASLSFEKSQSKKYAYKLKGVDNDWIYVDAGKRFAVYNNLAKGNYEFMVKAYNESGYWSNECATLQIIRLPAPWETNWAYLIYFIFLLGIFYLSYRIINYRIKLKRALEIEQLERVNSEEVHQAKLQFFTNISHELFTPITVLSCSLDNLSRKYPKDTTLIHIMEANLNRLMRLLQQILEFRKAETGNLKLKVSEDNIVTFIKEICDTNFSPLIGKKNISLEFISSEKNIPAYFDSDKLDKIMFNLISNAFKYNREGGSIEVSVEKIRKNETNYAEIKVRDTGKGIAQEALPNLFKRFYEGDYRKFKTKGTGIGLSLTKDLTKLHQGKITVESRLGEGTEFTVIIPINKEAYSFDQIDSQDITNVEYIENDTQKTEISLPEQDTSSDKLKNTTILLVEDNEDLLLVMNQNLQSDFNVKTATNGKEALLMLEEQVIDIVITDFVMPEMNGIELCKKMKSEIKWSHIPIILLTAKQNTEDKVEGYDAGADVYITKPFEITALIANIKSLVKNRAIIAKSFKDKKDILLNEFTYNSVDEEFLNKAIALVEENIRKTDFDTETFYQVMHMTQSTLYRKLKTLTNMSPNEFIRNIKFKAACKLLMERKLNISEVAYELGFDDPKYFSVAFKKEIGMTPSEYIKQSNSVK